MNENEHDHVIENLELALDVLRNMQTAQALGRHWSREQWIHARATVQEMVEQSLEELYGLRLAQEKEAQPA